MYKLQAICSITFLLLSKCLFGQTSNEKKVYIPKEWQTAHRNIPWDSANRSLQSNNFVLYWGPLAGNDPTNAIDKKLIFNPKAVLDTLEDIYDFYINKLQVVEEKGNLAKYKIPIVINNTWREGLYTGWAYGGGYDDVIGAMWVDPNSMKENGWVVAHEFIHSIQYMVGVLYPKHGYRDVDHAGFFWEMHANFMAIQRYPSFVTATDLPRAMNLSHYTFSSPRKHYGDWYLLQYLKDEYGLAFINNIWKYANQTAQEHPLQTIQRLLNFSQEQMNGLVIKYAAKRAGWDFGNQNFITTAEESLGIEHFFKKNIILDSLGDGRYAIPYNLAPQQYGFNIIELFKNEKECNSLNVQLRLKGHVINDNSGWRFALVGKSKQGKYVYSPFYMEGEINYSFPDNTEKFYLVVAGTPSSLDIHQGIFEAGFPNLKRYPWEIRIKGMLPDGYQNNFRNTSQSVRVHANGGGRVALTADVAASVYVGPAALVLDKAVVSGNVRIEGKALIRENATVKDNAVIKDFAVVGGNTVIAGNARVEKQAFLGRGNVINENAVISDNAALYNNKVSGNARIFGNAYSWGAEKLAGDIRIGGDAEIGGVHTDGEFIQIEGLRNKTGPANKKDVNVSYNPFTNAEMSFKYKFECTNRK